MLWEIISAGSQPSCIPAMVSYKWMEPSHTSGPATSWSSGVPSIDTINTEETLKPSLFEFFAHKSMRCNESGSCFKVLYFGVVDNQNRRSSFNFDMSRVHSFTCVKEWEGGWESIKNIQESREFCFILMSFLPKLICIII